MEKTWISFSGRGFGLKRIVIGEKRRLWFKLGYNRWKEWKLPKEVRVILFKKKEFLILGPKPMVQSHVTHLQHLRSPDIYHRKGIHLSQQILRRKTGKKQA